MTIKIFFQNDPCLNWKINAPRDMTEKAALKFFRKNNGIAQAFHYLPDRKSTTLAKLIFLTTISHQNLRSPIPFQDAYLMSKSWVLFVLSKIGLWGSIAILIIFTVFVIFSGTFLYQKPIENKRDSYGLNSSVIVFATLLFITTMSFCLIGNVSNRSSDQGNTEQDRINYNVDPGYLSIAQKLIDLTFENTHLAKTIAHQLNIEVIKVAYKKIDKLASRDLINNLSFGFKILNK